MKLVIILFHAPYNFSKLEIRQLIPMFRDSTNFRSKIFINHQEPLLNTSLSNLEVTDEKLKSIFLLNSKRLSPDT